MFQSEERVHFLGFTTLVFEEKTSTITQNHENITDNDDYILVY